MLENESVDTGAIRVLIVEDHRLLAELLTAALAGADGIRPVGIAQTCAEGERLARSATPDVILMDYHLPDGTGADLAHQIRQFAPRAAVVIVTSDTTDVALRCALAAGAVGYISKASPPSVVLEGVRRAASGEILVSPEQLRSLAMPRSAPVAEPPSHDLTRRELEVLRLMCEGRDTKGISAELDLEYNTVRGYAQRILEKLNVRSRLEAVVRARELRIIQSA